jgi:hypothetical protein
VRHSCPGSVDQVVARKNPIGSEQDGGDGFLSSRAMRSGSVRTGSGYPPVPRSVIVGLASKSVATATSLLRLASGGAKLINGLGERLSASLMN